MSKRNGQTEGGNSRLQGLVVDLREPVLAERVVRAADLIHQSTRGSVEYSPPRRLSEVEARLRSEVSRTPAEFGHKRPRSKSPGPARKAPFTQSPPVFAISSFALASFPHRCRLRLDTLLVLHAHSYSTFTLSRPLGSNCRRHRSWLMNAHSALAKRRSAGANRSSTT